MKREEAMFHDFAEAMNKHDLTRIWGLVHSESEGVEIVNYEKANDSKKVYPPNSHFSLMREILAFVLHCINQMAMENADAEELKKITLLDIMGAGADAAQRKDNEMKGRLIVDKMRMSLNGK